MTNSMVEFYDKHRISPVRQDIGGRYPDVVVIPNPFVFRGWLAGTERGRMNKVLLNG